MRVGSLLLVELLFFCSHIHAGDVLDEDGSTDDSNHTQRIGTGITIGDARSTVRENTEQCLVGSTKTWGVGNRTIEGAHHHRQVLWVAGVEEEVIASEHHEDVEQDSCGRKQVQRHTTFLETLEEARTHLHTNHEDKEYQSEVLHEGKDFLRAREAHVAGQDTCEEHEGNTQRDATNLDLSQIHTNRNHDCVE